MMEAAASGIFSRTAFQSFMSFLAGLRRRTPKRLLHVKERLELGEKRQLLIVECGGRRILLGAAGNFIATLAELGEREAEHDCE